MERFADMAVIVRPRRVGVCLGKEQVVGSVVGVGWISIVRGVGGPIVERIDKAVGGAFQTDA